nr:MAG TPA: hypothetical protein [Caudoviricetes sp.]
MARRGRTPYIRPARCRRRLGGAAAPLPLAGERPPAASIGAALRQGIGSTNERRRPCGCR